MPGVRAFVGHSFLDQDTDLVRKFTEFFDSLKSGVLDFDWVHATAARPEDVSAKVLELIEGKDLFIGICTRNEKVAKDNQFKRSLLGGRVSAKEDELKWKTSDWIIQEIGLAIGRGMTLLLLLENGVRQPGGLQGNLEYIAFSREAPEQAFKKILEMIGAMEPRAGVSLEKREGELATLTKNEENDAGSIQILRDPDSSWDLGQYRHQFFAGLVLKNEEHSEKVSIAYLKSITPEDQDAEGEWKAFCELNKLTLTDHGSLDTLVALAKKHERNSSVQERVARGYLHYDDLEHAQSHFRAAIESTDDPNREIDLLGKLAVIAQKRGNRAEVSAIVAKMRAIADSQKNEDRLLSNLAELSDWYKDDVLKAAILERELAIDPTNTQKRFQLAYLHAETDNEDLAMFHYEKIPANERDGSTWNNLGVVYQHFSLAGKSIDAFKESAKKGETLAMSNIANKFLASGFLIEASELIKEAQAHTSYHDSVASALVRLKEIPEEETETHDDKLKGVVEKSGFLSHVGEHVWRDSPKSVPAKLVEPKCQLAVSFENGVFEAKGTYSTEIKSDILNALAGTSTPPRSETHMVEYRGRFVGEVVIGEKTVENATQSSTVVGLLGHVPSKTPFVMVVPNGASNVRAMIGRELVELTFKRST